VMEQHLVQVEGRVPPPGGSRVSESADAPPRAARRLLIDLSPLRRSRDFRYMVWGDLVPVLGNQLTTVAVPFQVYQLGGSAVDAMDRRRLLMMAQVLMLAGFGACLIDINAMVFAMPRALFRSPWSPAGRGSGTWRRGR